MVKKIKQDWKKTGIKVLKTLAAIIVAGVAVKYGNSDWYITLAPVVVGLDNYLKHKYQIDIFKFLE